MLKGYKTLLVSVISTLLLVSDALFGNDSFVSWVSSFSWGSAIVAIIPAVFGVLRVFTNTAAGKQE